ncbi:MAG: hypothetical protein L6Q99_06080 [Planctomycetes bacterium]|nr:hypothetical protein [Planctomycetota bacterium]
MLECAKCFLVLAAAVVCIASSATAQGDSWYKEKPKTPEQQATIDAAVAYLSSVHVQIPTNVQIIGGDIAKTTAAMTTRDGQKIVLDFDQFEMISPMSIPGLPGKPGVIAVILYHERLHTLGTFLQYGYHCQELAIQNDTAAFHCTMMTQIAASGGGPLDSLCAWYEMIRNAQVIQVQAALQENPNCPASVSVPPCGPCTP